MAETSVPGFVVCLDANNLAAHLGEQSEVASWLLKLEAMMWAPFEEWPHRYFVLFAEEEQVWAALNVLHLRPLPGPGDHHLGAAYVGPSAFALSIIDQRRVLVRLAQLKAEQVGSAPSPAQPPSDSEMHGTVAWRGHAVPTLYKEDPLDCHFRLKHVEVGGAGRELSRTWIKAIIEQGLEQEFVDDVTLVLVRPGFPYTDGQNIAKYNLDFVFVAETRYISFMNSSARTGLIRFIKEHMDQCSVSVGDPDSIGRPPTFPERTKENQAYYAQARARSEQDAKASTSGRNVGWNRASGPLPAQKDTFYARFGPA
ncbi:hypothetical protein JCM3774_001361 [Rhodotorula dairenensis]